MKLKKFLTGLAKIFSPRKKSPPRHKTIRQALQSDGAKIAGDFRKVLNPCSESQPAEIANSQSQDCWFTRERVEEDVKNYTQFLKSPLFKKICEM